jgi:DNA gyrase/topoisomerase IV subunit B
MKKASAGYCEECWYLQGEETGTSTTFRYDRSIFLEEVSYRFETLAQRFREMAFVTRGVSIKLIDERSGREMTFHFEGVLPPSPDMSTETVKYYIHDLW